VLLPGSVASSCPSRLHAVRGETLALLLVTLLFTRNASGEPNAGPIAEIVAVGPGCPEEDALRREAESRIPPHHDPSRQLSVRIAPSNAGFDGTVSVLSVSAPPEVIATRTVRGATCSDVASAALLLVALGVLEAPAPVEPLVDTSPGPCEPSMRAARRGTVSIAAIATLLTGVGPLAAGGGLRVGIGLDDDGWFRPEVQIGADAFAEGMLSNAQGTASRRLYVGRIDLCPVAVGRGRLTARVCGAGALGVIRVRGEAVDVPKDEGRFFGALGGLARADARLAGGFGVRISVGALAPLTRHRFFFDPDETLLVLDKPSFLSEAGLSWSIP